MTTKYFGNQDLTQIHSATLSAPSGLATFLNLGTGSSAGLSAANTGNIRYNEITNTFEVSENGAAYVDLTVGGNAFIQNGNSFGANATLGTNDNFPLIFETNALARMRITETGDIGIGTAGPVAKFHIARTSTATAGGQDLTEFTSLVANPAADSATTFIGKRMVVTSDANLAFNLTGALQAGIFSAQSDVGVGKTLTSASGVIGDIEAGTGAGTGTVTNSYSLHSKFQINNGTVADHRGLYVETPVIAAGTLTNAYGIYVDSQTSGTNKYGIYVKAADTLALWIDSGSSRFDGRILGGKGADVASANDLTLGTDGNTFLITGAVTINAIAVANWTAGSHVTLIFSGAPTVKHNTAGGAGTAVLFLAGSADLVAAANTVLGLVYDGTQFQETFRKVA